jgi:hypothetical protein
VALRLGGCPSQGDHLVDDVGVHRAGDDRDGLRVARGGFRVGASEVAVLAGPGAEPGVLQLLRAGQLAQLGQGDVDNGLSVGAGPGRDQPGA